MTPKKFLRDLRHEEIVAAIQRAEKETSGEIRVFVSRHEPIDAVVAAQAEFLRLKMNETLEKNAILIYVAPLARKFAIIGDAGIHARCGDEFWKAVAEGMTGHFKRGEFTEGIAHGIRMAGELLARHFPGKPDHPNQLSDDVAHD